MNTEQKQNQRAFVKGFSEAVTPAPNLLPLELFYIKWTAFWRCLRALTALLNSVQQDLVFFFADAEDVIVKLPRLGDANGPCNLQCSVCHWPSRCLWQRHKQCNSRFADPQPLLLRMLWNTVHIFFQRKLVAVTKLHERISVSPSSIAALSAALLVFRQGSLPSWGCWDWT